MSKTARDVAVAALIQWEREQTYSGIMLDHLLKAETLSSVEAAFATRLVYGVIERLLSLDYVLTKNSRQPLKKCHPAVRAILRVGAYQLLFTDHIPPSAAVNEAVSQTKRMKQGYAGGFVNGVLRAVSRDGRQLLADTNDDSVRYSVPKPLLTYLRQTYGDDTARALVSSFNEVPPSVIRINTLKISVAAFCDLLEKEGIAFSDVYGLPEALQIEDAMRLRASSVSDDFYYFQDAASQWACEALDAQSGESIADVCAAPGGKSFTTAMKMGGTGTVMAFDIYPEKVRTVAMRAKRYGMDCLSAMCRDASSECPTEWQGRFDRVICDVPCSGLGVIRRRPEIRYKPIDSFEDLPELQYRILCEAAKMAKAGGILQYSTCTVRKEENEQVVSRFLAEHPAFSAQTLSLPLLWETRQMPAASHITLMPHLDGTDGFFIASLRKEDLS